MKLKKLNADYRTNIEEYRSLMAKVKDIRERKEAMRIIQKKLYALKDKQTLSSDEAKFVDEI